MNSNENKAIIFNSYWHLENTKDQIDFQSCDILKSSLDIVLFTQTQVNRLCTKPPGWSPKAYDVQKVKPEELTVSSRHQSFMNLLLKFCFQCLIPLPSTADFPAMGQAAPGHGRGGQEHGAPFALATTSAMGPQQSGILVKSFFSPDLGENYRKAERLWSCAAQDTVTRPKELQ